MIVCPISRRNESFGVLSLRLPPEKTTISDNEVRFVEIVSHVVSLVLGNEVHKAKGQLLAGELAGVGSHASATKKGLISERVMSRQKLPGRVWTCRGFSSI